MVMPNDIDTSIVRAFVGRMLLLQGDMAMANTGLRFEDYTKATTRHLEGDVSVDSVMSLACPPGRVLKASDSSCTLAIWVPANGTNVTTEQCMRNCNTRMPVEQEVCKKLQCVKTGTVPNGGNDCWMMCLPHLTPDQCPAPGVEKCDSNNQVLDCKSPPTTQVPTPPPTLAPTTTTTVAPTPAPTPDVCEGNKNICFWPQNHQVLGYNRDDCAKFPLSFVWCP
ncbi:Aste57867_2104 [Aphanomyces stellatus]|uniref:Aste57867_2104 protein n=1 Tax=Aphanomyces stellatus TaxID=120398 RepID=A0A485KBX3_9STRA|nr:hypothetical protein As57867_002099 [Aphanomyces stellatus]VFT79307.1 Aste57867_2104 [Aphanomyces stellatus]